MGDGVATNVVLVRHARHDRVASVLCGRMPGVTLGEVGRLEAAALARRLGGVDIAAVYTSPLERTQETAQAIADEAGVTIIVSQALNEIDVGEWTGRTFGELESDERWQVWNMHRAGGQAPGGESMASVRRRTAREIETWQGRHPGERVVAVSHCDVIKTMICGVIGLSLDRYLSFDIEPASVSEIAVWEGGGKLLRLNEAVAS